MLFLGYSCYILRAQDKQMTTILENTANRTESFITVSLCAFWGRQSKFINSKIWSQIWHKTDWLVKCENFQFSIRSYFRSISVIIILKEDFSKN